MLKRREKENILRYSKLKLTSETIDIVFNKFNACEFVLEITKINLMI